ncbi:MAG: VacJ family lipoprotein, partial [Alphaproteobacteria bacterium]|nr:VacJ family lipoprotein [Alphaproteobacteria bacterium]
MSRILFLVLALALLLGACAGRDKGLDKGAAGDPRGTDEIADPLENFNRTMFAFNDKVDTVAIKPVARVYRFVLPEPVRKAIRSFLRNVNTPVILANDLMQGQFGRAEQTTARFLINTTVGIGGLFDIAEKVGIEYHSEDFGQTLAVWGLGDGFYLVLPL